MESDDSYLAGLLISVGNCRTGQGQTWSPIQGAEPESPVNMPPDAPMDQICETPNQFAVPGFTEDMIRRHQTPNPSAQIVTSENECRKKLTVQKVPETPFMGDLWTPGFLENFQSDPSYHDPVAMPANNTIALVSCPKKKISANATVEDLLLDLGRYFNKIMRGPIKGKKQSFMRRAQQTTIGAYKEQRKLDKTGPSAHACACMAGDCFVEDWGLFANHLCCLNILLLYWVAVPELKQDEKLRVIMSSIILQESSIHNKTNTGEDVYYTGVNALISLESYRNPDTTAVYTGWHVFMVLSTATLARYLFNLMADILGAKDTLHRQLMMGEMLNTFKSYVRRQALIPGRLKNMHETSMPPARGGLELIPPDRRFDFGPYKAPKPKEDMLIKPRLEKLQLQINPIFNEMIESGVCGEAATTLRALQASALGQQLMTLLDQAIELAGQIDAPKVKPKEKQVRAKKRKAEEIAAGVAAAQLMLEKTDSSDEDNIEYGERV